MPSGRTDGPHGVCEVTKDSRKRAFGGKPIAEPLNLSLLVLPRILRVLKIPLVVVKNGTLSTRIPRLQEKI